MIENFSQLSADAQHLVETFGDIDMSIIDTLQERGSNYGDAAIQFGVAQRIKEAMHSSNRYHNLPPMIKETLDMIAHKISRVIVGDPLYKDNWHDIQGYAKLVEDWIIKNTENKIPKRKIPDGP